MKELRGRLSRDRGGHERLAGRDSFAGIAKAEPTDVKEGAVRGLIIPFVSIILLIIITPLMYVAGRTLGRSMPVANAAIVAMWGAAILNAVLGVGVQTWLVGQSSLPGALRNSRWRLFVGAFVVISIFAAHVGLNWSSGARTSITAEQYLNGLVKDGATVLYDRGPYAHSSDNRRWLVHLPPTATRSSCVVWLDHQARSGLEYVAHPLKLPTKLGDQFDTNETPVLNDVIAGDFTQENDGIEVVMLWSHPRYPISCLETRDENGQPIFEPLWSVGELQSVIYSEDCYVVLGKSCLLPCVEPTLATWDMRRRQGDASLHPDVIFAIHPEAATGIVFPVGPIGGAKSAELQWMLARQSDPSVETGGSPWSVTLVQLNPVRRDSRFMCEVVARVSSVDGSMSDHDTTIRITRDGQVASSHTGYTTSRRLERALELVPIDMDFSSMVLRSIVHLAPLTGSPEDLKQMIMKTMRVRTSPERVHAIIDRFWSSPRMLNIIAWLVAFGPLPDPHICEQYADALDELVSSAELLPSDRQHIYNTKGMLLFRAAEVNAIEALLENQPAEEAHALIEALYTDARAALEQAICGYEYAAYSIGVLSIIEYRLENLEKADARRLSYFQLKRRPNFQPNSYTRWIDAKLEEARAFQVAKLDGQTGDQYATQLE